MPDVVEGSVAVAFLDDGEHWAPCFGLSYRNLWLHDALTSRRIYRETAEPELRGVTGTGGIAINRNKAAARFLDHTDAEWLWFVDTDMGFAADTVDRLVAAADPVARPVVGALCFSALRERARGNYYAERFRIQPTIYTWIEQPGEVGVVPLLDYPRDALVLAGATGAACILIHRDVLAKIRANYGDVWFEPITHPHGQNNGPRTFSEDLSFCLRLAAADIPLHIDTSVRTTHAKGHIFLDEDTFDEHMAMMRLKDEMRALAGETAQ